MLAPRWIQLRIGPLLRGGIDLKAYHRQILLMGLFRSRDEEIVGLKRFWLRCLAQRESESDWIDAPYTVTDPLGRKLIVFRGCEGLFRPLNGWDEFLHQQLYAITQPRWLCLAETLTPVPIGINVRLGNDFKSARSSDDFYAQGAIKTPLAWYVDNLQLIRECVGFPVKAVVTSDGARGDLKALLDLENVVFARPGCAISDLLLMARAKIFIGAGGSSFSAWAAFLGQMPAISHPGQPLTWFQLVNRKGCFVGEFDPALPDPAFLEQAERILSSLGKVS